MERNAAVACILLALFTLPVLTPFSAGLYLGPRVKVEMLRSSVLEGEFTTISVNIFDQDGNKVPNATVQMTATAGTLDQGSKTTNFNGYCAFGYTAPTGIGNQTWVEFNATAVYGSPPYTYGGSGIWVNPRMSVQVSGPAQVLKGGGPVRYNVTVTSGGEPIPGATASVQTPSLGSAGSTGGPTDQAGRTWFQYIPPSDRTGNVTLTVTASSGQQGSAQGSIAVRIVEQAGDLGVSVGSDANPLPSWGSCNLTAAVTDGGQPVGGAAVEWTVSRGWLSARSSSTDARGRATVQYTAMNDSPGLWAGAVSIFARATSSGASGEGSASLTVAPYAVAWRGNVSCRASAAYLFPGEQMWVEVRLGLDHGMPWQFITPFRVEAELRDSASAVVNRLTLGEGLSLLPGMDWSSGQQVLLSVPQSPTAFMYSWTFRILSGNGLYTYYEPESPVRVNVQLSGRDDWTFLIYLNGDSNLGGESAYFFNQLETEAPSDEFKVLLQWDNVYSGVWRYELRHDTDAQNVNSLLLETLPERDSGDPATFYEFLLWGASRAPAGHYCVVVWDHGGSYIGSSSDYSSDSIITNDELAGRLGDFMTHRRKADVLVFDTCLMSSMEVAYQFRDVANYLAGSETTINCDFLVPEALSLLKAYYPDHRPSPLQVATDILSGFELRSGPLFPFTVIDAAAAHTALNDLDALGNALLEKWTSVDESILSALSSSLKVRGPYGNTVWLVDAKSYLQNLTRLLEAQPFSFRLAEQTGAIQTLLASHDGMILSRLVSMECNGVSLFLPATGMAYNYTRSSYLSGGLPAGHGWTRVLERLFHPSDFTPFHPYPPVQGYISYPVLGAAVFGQDSDDDGLYESLSATAQVDQLANSASATILVDLVAYNGSRAADFGDLASRKVVTVPAGTSSFMNISLTSPVSDLVDAVLTVLTDKGFPLGTIPLGSFLMNATPGNGSPPSLRISASKTSMPEGRKVDFTASAGDADGTAVTLWWDLDDSDGVGMDAAGPSAAASYRGARNRTVTCIATDGEYFVVERLGIVVLPDAANRQPVANLTGGFLDWSKPLKATLNASMSTDPDGGPVEFAFNFGDGSWTGWVTGAVAEHEYAAPGNYDCIVRVRDQTEYGGSAALLQLQAGGAPANRPPVALLRLSPSRVRVGQALTADGSGSADPDAGDALLFRVDWGDGNLSGWSPSANATHTFAGAGSFNITLTVRDRSNATASAASTVSVAGRPKTINVKGFIPGPTVAPAVIALALAVALKGRRKR